MSELNIEELKAAAEAATPGPWRSMYSGRGNAVYYHVSATAPAIPRFCAERSIEIASINPSAGADQANSFFIGLANPTTILTLIERLQVAEDAAKDAERWRETLRHVGGTYNLDGMPKFTLRYLKPIKGINILNGGVSGHFTDAIDAAIAARRLTP